MLPITPQAALLRCIEHRDISHDEMLILFRHIMSGDVSPIMIAALTIALRVKRESVDEIAAAAQVMREFSDKVTLPDTTDLLDIVGTGGDQASTFNISTATMFVAAAAGARVAKHGGRSVSSSSGSADVLEALGVNINLKPEQIAQTIEQTNIGFMFAPNHHSAMKHAAPVRKELGIRTIFNILGPLTNPAGAPNILMGVFNAELVNTQIQVLQRLHTKRAIVVWGQDNIDEVSISAPTMVAELINGQIKQYEITPEQFGLTRAPRDTLIVNNAQESKQKIIQALHNQPGATSDIVAFNAGVALYAAGVANNIQDGLALARSTMISGAAYNQLQQFIQITQTLANNPT